MTLLADLRLLYRDESHVEHLTAAAPPIVRQVIERSKGYDLIEEQEPADQIGRSLSAAMVTLIGSITAELSFYPSRFPVRRALAEWDRLCRRRHRLPTWTDHGSGPVCSLMLRVMVEHGASLAWAADQQQVSYPRAERLVGAGAHFVWLRLVHWDHERAGIALEPDCAMCLTRRTPFHVDRERAAG